MAHRLSSRSMDRLQGVHPLLVAVVVRALAISETDFGVAEGLRTSERQAELLGQGATRTLKSKHLPQPDGFGHAVDIYPAGFRTVDAIPTEAYDAVSRAMLMAAEDVGLPAHGLAVRWGNDWDRDGVPVAQDPDESFRDAPHYELVEVTA